MTWGELKKQVEQYSFFDDTTEIVIINEADLYCEVKDKLGFDGKDRIALEIKKYYAEPKQLKSGIISQLDIANSTMYSKITEKTIKEALISLDRVKKKNG